ncbi:hypothetical protein [Dietzia sp. KRD202]|nr:hypothetical protein [Dietzia sp. KRD202]
MTTQTIDIPHLGGSTIGYKFGRDYDPSERCIRDRHQPDPLLSLRIR